MPEPDDSLEMSDQEFAALTGIEDPKEAAVAKQVMVEQFKRYVGEGMEYPPIASQDVVIDESRLRKVAISDFENLAPLPAARKEIPFSRKYTEKEIERMSYGVAPASMDEKWIIIMTEEKLHFFRSHSRQEVIRMLFERQAQDYVVRKTWVDQELMQTEWNSPEYMAKLVDYLVERLLLGRVLRFPFPESVTGFVRKGMFKHSLIGNGLANDEH